MLAARVEIEHLGPLLMGTACRSIPAALAVLHVSIVVVAGAVAAAVWSLIQHFWVLFLLLKISSLPRDNRDTPIGVCHVTSRSEGVATP